MAYPIVTSAELIGQLYVGYFGRAADPAGLDYWVGRYNDGMSLLAVANSFAVQPEATALYSYLAAPSLGDPQAFIAAIYGDLFNRAPDAAGLDYWVTQLTAYGTPPGQMVLDVISGAQGSDRTTIENKTHVAVGHAQASHGVVDAHAAVASVTADPATVAAVLGITVHGFGTYNITSTTPKYPTTEFNPMPAEAVWLLGDFKGVGVLKLTADNAATTLSGSHDDVVVLGLSGGVGVGETVVLIHDPEPPLGVIKVDLGAVEGPTAVFDTTGTEPLSIVGGIGETNALFGGSAADTIVANGRGPGFGSNFIWGGLGGDTERGAGGGAAGTAGTVFLIHDRDESPGGAPWTTSGAGVHITNFNGGTDTLLVSPEALALHDIPAFVGVAVDYGQALALLSGGGAAQTQAVYQSDAGALWIDADNNGLLNTQDVRVFVAFSDAGFRSGARNFGDLLGVLDGEQATAYIDAKLALIAEAYGQDAAIDLIGMPHGDGADTFP